MLQTLSIQNFAIIDELIVDFSKGLTVLTGETGAGKSIIIDALSLLAGSRGSSEYIRYGQTKAILQAQYSIQDNTLNTLLLDNQIPNENNTLILYRELHQNGKNVIRINGVLTTVSLLKLIGSYIIDVHGQHEHQQLLNENYHLQLLDQFGHKELDVFIESYYNAYRQYTTSKKDLKQLLQLQQQDNERINLLKKNIEVIEKVNAQQDEDTLLMLERVEMLQQKEQYDVLTYVANELFQEENDIVGRLQTAITRLNNVKIDNQDMKKMSNILGNMSEQLYDINKTVSKWLEFSEFDEQHFQDISVRLEQLDQLKQQFDLPLNSIIEQYDSFKNELDQLLHTDKYIVQAQEKFLSSRNELEKAGKVLSEKRKRVAEQLEMAIQQQFADLYMEKVLFKVNFIEKQKSKFKKDGMDDIVFYSSTNVGEPFKPLAKVASGGELSRMMLAMKTIFLKDQSIHTIVFDEIDTGVSGRVAQAIANKMAVISQYTQVLSITHLPQVAAMAHHHAFVTKQIVGERTATQLHYLNDNLRIEEIAKMFASNDVSNSALQHALELLTIANQFKKTLID